MKKFFEKYLSIIVCVILIVICGIFVVYSLYLQSKKSDSASAASSSEVGVVPDVASEYAYFGTYVYKISDYTQYSDIIDDIVNKESYYITIYHGGVLQTFADDMFFAFGGSPFGSPHYFGINVQGESVKFYVADTPANSISDTPNTKNIFWLTVNTDEYYYFTFLLVGVPNDSIKSEDNRYLWVDRFFNLSCTQITNPSQYQTGYDNGYAEGEVNGREQGIEIGYGQGYAGGYNKGYNDALGSASGNRNQFFDLVSAVFDAPIQAFTGLFDFEIFGYNMKSLLLALFTIAIIVTIIKIVLPFG